MIKWSHNWTSFSRNHVLMSIVSLSITLNAFKKRLIKDSIWNFFLNFKCHIVHITFIKSHFCFIILTNRQIKSKSVVFQLLVPCSWFRMTFGKNRRKKSRRETLWRRFQTPTFRHFFFNFHVGKIARVIPPNLFSLTRCVDLLAYPTPSHPIPTQSGPGHWRRTAFPAKTQDRKKRRVQKRFF